MRLVKQDRQIGKLLKFRRIYKYDDLEFGGENTLWRLGTFFIYLSTNKQHRVLQQFVNPNSQPDILILTLLIRKIRLAYDFACDILGRSEPSQGRK